MHAGVTGQIRKTALGRCLLFHINTGLFWIYGLLTFILAFSLGSFWLQSVVTRALLSLPLALLAAFTLARLIHVLFWRRFRNVSMDSYVISVFLAAILLVSYVLDVREGRQDALFRLVERAMIVVIAGLISYASSRKRAV